MTRDPIVRRRKLRVAVAAVAVGVLMSALVAVVLICLAGEAPGS